MMRPRLLAALLPLTPCLQAAAQSTAAEEVRRPAAVSTLEEAGLVEFEAQPGPVKSLIRSALALTRLNLTYLFGSNDPARGGMDCSGTIHHLLSSAGIRDVPRQSDEMCDWLAGRGLLHRTGGAAALTSAEFARLRPGDLVFWSGTYEPAARKTPVTHVMLFLGTNKKGGRPVVFGASDGRRYEGLRRTGVSVFDLAFPKPGARASLHGYGPIPGLVSSSPAPASLPESTPQNLRPARKGP